ncbi:MAG TPA: macrolide ABC transporter permease [Bacteroidetes bacterium]|nr:macrolide ABC transporter permease [Bacteroidota bacterium]
MISSLFTSIGYALDNIRLNFFHTILSVLGIIIGVSALITMLAMIDGLEQFAENQIRETTSLNMIQVSSQKNDFVDGVSIRRDDPVIISDDMYREIMSVVTFPTNSYRYSNRGKEITYSDLKLGSVLSFVDSAYTSNSTMLFGEHLYDSFHENSNVAVINTALAKKLSQSDTIKASVLGSNIQVDDSLYEIIGITSDESRMSTIMIAIHHLVGNELKEYPPSITLEAENIENVQAIKASLDEWLESSKYTSDEIVIASNEFRVEQATRGFMLFRLVMGLIVGISVVVGGVGVMNVLLISVTQRTNEIGVRKAVGSRKKDIYIQFLSESMIVSLFGTVCGIIVGILVTLAITPIVYKITELSFDPVFSIPTILIITIVSMIIGVLFGTFPAYKASQLDPIEALRRD